MRVRAIQTIKKMPQIASKASKTSAKKKKTSKKKAVLDPVPGLRIELEKAKQAYDDAIHATRKAKYKYNDAKEEEQKKEKKKVDLMITIGGHLIKHDNTNKHTTEKLECWKEKGVYKYACVAEAMDDVEAFHENGQINIESRSWSQWVFVAKRNGDIDGIDELFFCEDDFIDDDEIENEDQD